MAKFSNFRKFNAATQAELRRVAATREGMGKMRIETVKRQLTIGTRVHGSFDC